MAGLVGVGGAGDQFGLPDDRTHAPPVVVHPVHRDLGEAAWAWSRSTYDVVSSVYFRPP